MVKQDEIIQLMSDIREHYEKNLNNKYVKNIILKLDITSEIKHNMNIILDYKTLYFDSKGSIEDIYSSIKAIYFFIKEIRNKVLIHINDFSGSGFIGTSSPQQESKEKILFQMAVKNYPMNIIIFTKMIQQLLVLIKDYDETNFTTNPAYKTFKEIDDVNTYFLDIIKENEKKPKAK